MPHHNKQNCRPEEEKKKKTHQTGKYKIITIRNKKNKNGNIFVVSFYMLAEREKKNYSRKIGKIQQAQKAFKIISSLESESQKGAHACARLSA